MLHSVRVPRPEYTLVDPSDARYSLAGYVALAQHISQHEAPASFDDLMRCVNRDPTFVAVAIGSIVTHQGRQNRYVPGQMYIRERGLRAHFDEYGTAGIRAGPELIIPRLDISDAAVIDLHSKNGGLYLAQETVHSACRQVGLDRFTKFLEISGQLLNRFLKVTQ